VTVEHQHDHRTRFPGGDQVIENPVRLSMFGPGALVVARAVLEHEQREFFLP
jgi:hypothetical protein